MGSKLLKFLKIITLIGLPLLLSCRAIVFTGAAASASVVGTGAAALNSLDNTGKVAAHSLKNSADSLDDFFDDGIYKNSCSYTPEEIFFAYKTYFKDLGTNGGGSYDTLSGQFQAKYHNKNIISSFNQESPKHTNVFILYGEDGDEEKAETLFHNIVTKLKKK